MFKGEIVKGTEGKEIPIEKKSWSESWRQPDNWPESNGVNIEVHQ